MADEERRLRELGLHPDEGDEAGEEEQEAEGSGGGEEA